MRFMCTVRMDPKIIATMTASDWKAFQNDTRKFDHELITDGRFVMASPLDGEAVRTIRLRAGTTLVTDGPFAETKEFLAGFIIFDAATLEEALSIAQRSAFVRVGSVELRALTDYEDRPSAGVSEI